MTKSNLFSSWLKVNGKLENEGVQKLNIEWKIKYPNDIVRENNNNKQKQY